MGKVIYVDSPGEDTDIHPAVQAAFTAAVDGDVIQLPAGNFTFLDDIYNTKKVSLRGATNGGRTVLYRPESMSDAAINALNNFIWWDINSSTPVSISCSYITFKCKLPSKTPNDGGSLAASVGIRIYKANGFVVSNCDFYYFGDSGVYIKHFNNQANVLVTGCNFIECKGYDGIGLGYGVVVYGDGIAGGWVASPGFGTSNFVFCENNKFIGTRHAIAANKGSLYVARYNTVKDNLIAAGMDMHENNGGEIASRAGEIYRNTIINDYFPITRFANAAARAAFAPYSVGDHYAIQTDTQVTYVSTGLAAGNWAVATLPIPTRNGCPIVAGKDHFQLTTAGINIRGGEALCHHNTIRGFRIAHQLKDHVTDAPPYPIPYGIGYASGLALGSGHTGTSMPNADGDCFFWSNTVDLYNGSCLDIDNSEDSTAFQENRDWHRVAKPGYVEYTYPHPMTYIAK